MDKNTKIIIGAIIVFGVVWLGYSMSGTKKPTETGAIKIGAILPLSGNLAFFGEEIKKGVDLAVDELKREGVDIQVIYEDDQSLSPRATANAANKLLNIDKIDVGLTMLVEESRPIAPIFNDKKIPLLVLWDSNKFIKESGEYLFSNGFSTEMAGRVMAEYARKSLGLRKIAILEHIDPWAEIIAKSFKDNFKEMGGSVVYDEKIPADTTDYRTSILKIKKLNPDGVYFPMVPMNSVRFLTQSDQLGLKSVFLTGDGFIQDVIDKSGDSSEGVYFTNIFTANPDDIASKYQAVYGKNPLDITLVSFGYDGVLKISEAYKKSKKSIKGGMDMVFGENRSADKVEKIFKVVNGVAVEVN